jgi:hypothetical protein
MSADLDLRITLADDDRTLEFELDSSIPGLGYVHYRVGEVHLVDEPSRHIQRVFEELSQRAQVSPDAASAIEQSRIVEELASTGQRLYRDLLPDGLKQFYRRVRRIKRGRPWTLTITSDEPWIPWELIKPYEEVQDTGEIIDDPFLCESYYLTRWLAGVAPLQILEVRRLAVVAPDSDLEHVQRESESIRGLTEANQAKALPTLHDVAAVKSGLRQGDTQLWHFACHGNYVNDVPDASGIALGEEMLRAEDIIGPVHVGIRKGHPLVMLNACHTGRQGFALTGLGGWAQRLLAAGATAFIGSQWEANDALAADFAIALYGGLTGGLPLGEAVHAARLHIRDLDPANSTWLTYVAYGHPSLEVRLAGQPRPAGQAPLEVRPWPPGPAFVVGKPVHPRHFFGRGREIIRLSQLLTSSPLQNAAVIGQKRSGKTSLLRYLRDLNTVRPGDLRPGQKSSLFQGSERYRWVYVDFQDVRTGTRQGFLREVLRQLEWPAAPDLSLEGFLDLVGERLESPVVILLDEVGVALHKYSQELDETFWEALRWLAQSQAGENLSFILASHESPYQIAQFQGVGSPFFNIFGYTATLGPLTPDEARELVDSSPVPFPSEDTDWIIERSGRWPILMQALCAERLSALEQGDGTESWKASGEEQITQHLHLLEQDDH